jgi:hypothetical protein
MRLSTVRALLLSAPLVLSACGGGGGGMTPDAGPASKFGSTAVGQSTSSHFVYLTSDDIFSLPAQVFAFNSSASESEFPMTVIQYPSPVAGGINGVAIDGKGDSYASYFTAETGSVTTSAITEYSPLGPSSTLLRTIAGSNTDLQNVTALSVTPDGRVFVLETAAPPGCSMTPHLLEFSASASGNVAPIRDITNVNGNAGGLLAVGSDGTAYVPYVSDQNGTDVGTIQVFGPNVNGDQPPIATIAGSATQLGAIFAVVVTANAVAVTSGSQHGAVDQILEYPLNANGNEPPSNTIGLPNGGGQLAIDSSGDFDVLSGKTVYVYPGNSSGTPSAIESFVPAVRGYGGVFLGEMAAF